MSQHRNEGAPALQGRGGVNGLTIPLPDGSVATVESTGDRSSLISRSVDGECVEHPPVLRCSYCDEPVGDDHHDVHEDDCKPGMDCRCDLVACPSCCPTCSISDAAESSVAPVGMLPAGAPSGDGLGSVRPPTGSVSSHSRLPEAGSTQPSPRAVQDGQKPGQGQADTTNNKNSARVGCHRPGA